jgi:CxxC motif-containing protein (DUF1111 family)
VEPQDAFYIWHGFAEDVEIEVGWGGDEYEASNNSITFPREELEALIEFLEEQLTMTSEEATDAA